MLRAISSLPAGPGLAAALTVLLFLAGAFPLAVVQVASHPDEARYSVAAARMIATGDYLIPYAAWGDARLVKPPLTYYYVAAGFALFGQSVFGAKVFWLVSSAAILGLTWALARGIGASRTGAAFAVTALASNLLFFRSALIHNPDIPMTLGLTLALVGAVCAFSSQPQRLWVPAAIWFGLAWAFLAKGLLSVVLAVLIVGTRVAVHGRARPRAAEVALAGLAAIVAFWWHAAVAIEDPAALWSQFVGDQVGDRGETDPSRWAVGLIHNAGYLLLGFAPALAVLVALPGMRRPRPGPAAGLLVVWVLIVLTVFAFSDYHSERYILPALPAAAALLGRAASGFDPDALAVRAGRSARLFLFVPLGLGLVSAAILSAVSYPAAAAAGLASAGAGGLAWRLAGRRRLLPSLVVLAALLPLSVLAAWPAWRTLGQPAGADIAAAEIEAAGVPNDRVAVLLRWQLLERIGLRSPPIEAYRFALSADPDVLDGVEIAVAVHGHVAADLEAQGWLVEMHRGAPYGYALAHLVDAVIRRDITGFRDRFGETVYVARAP